MENQGVGKRIFSPVGLAALVIILAFLCYQLLQVPPKYVRVTFFDVGQGDASLVETPEKQKILIDGGPNDVISAKLDKTVPFYGRTLDAVILSHPHADHLVGLIKVLKRYQVKAVYLTGVLHTTPEYIDFLNEIRAKKISVHTVSSGDYLDLGKGVKIDFLYPVEDLSGKQVENLNNSSIVARFVWGKSSVLFTGDLEKEGQIDLMNQNIDLKSSILKVPHHGSKDGAGKEFFEKIAPQYSVVSVGKDNSFGHPSSDALNLLKSTILFRTDYDGDIKFSVTEDSISPL